MLINSVAYQGGNRLRDVPVADVPQVLAEPDCFVWIALKDPQPEEIDLVHDIFQLADLAVEDARHGHQRPKLEEYGDELFVALHLPEFRDGELLVGELNVFAGNRYVVSVRSRSGH
ncbi:MAG: CorA family divalent cation transporter, partial [Gammaproteobacteria bacterium]